MSLFWSRTEAISSQSFCLNGYSSHSCLFSTNRFTITRSPPMYARSIHL